MIETEDMVCQVSAGNFFTQKLIVGNKDEHSWEYCKYLCRDKKVLHVGCSDYPFSNPAATLHVFLSGWAKELHGCDINGVEEIKKHYNGIYFDAIENVTEKYDMVIAPNIIEHLENPGIFVEKLFKIPFNEMFVLVPNYKISEQSIYEDGVFTERIHPDHYAWYSPYTLWKLFSKHISGRKCEMNFFDNKNMISILIK